jgi:hypothetical protein
MTARIDDADAVLIVRVPGNARAVAADIGIDAGKRQGVEGNGVAHGAALLLYSVPMNVLIFGATGMVGQGVLRECLLATDVAARDDRRPHATGVQHRN